MLLQSIGGQYYSAHLRFFRQLCTAAKVDEVSKLARKVLDEGKCVVIGLQSTGKSRVCKVQASYVCAWSCTSLLSALPCLLIAFLSAQLVLHAASTNGIGDVQFVKGS